MAESESRRKKLDLLARSLAARDVKGAEAILRSRGSAGAGASGRALGQLGTVAPHRRIPLHEAAPGKEVAVPEGRYWLIRRSLEEVSGDYLGVQGEYLSVLRGARQRFDELSASPGICRIADGRPEEPLFLDIETCGLVGSCVFLVGLMSYRQGQLVFEQLLARHYGEEQAILGAFARRLESAGALVTFNGKAFDMTNLRERAAFHGIGLGDEPPHCDLLHEVRRHWRGVLPNCRLQTLEQFLCRRRRIDDIPGHDIPQAYHDFVSGGDARKIKVIVHHNLMDLLTMSQLLCALLTGEQPAMD
jgi:uncharacterized protein YprB with RNaseH-like and TPR domain